MPTLEIDGRTVTVENGLNLIQAAERLGIEVPHYCYHPALSISGNCRMCLVEIEKMPRLQIACNTRVAEGMVVRTTSPKVKTAQAAVLEFLLINHPIDCPVCDQAGECKLQDYYMDYGVYRSRFPLEAKVEKRKVVDLGPQVVLDQERCILCARCTRFLDEVTKTSELGIFARGDHCYIDLFPGKRLDNLYSGNVVDVCPVGALTSKDFRFKARVWYLEKIESICTRCATGCNIDIYHRHGQMYRFRPRSNPDVNQYWMCDEGRLWYKELQTESRLLRPLVRGESDFTAVTWEQALSRVVDTLRRVKEEHGAGAIAGIVGAKATNEEAYLFARLLTEQLGSELVAGLSWSPANASHDDFLIRADKNPNTRGLQALGVLNGRTSAADILATAEQGAIKALAVFGIDLVTAFGQEKADKALSNADIIVFDTDHTGTTEYADVVLPIGTAPETDGTFTNYAGWVQRVRQAFPPPGEAKPGWEVLSLLNAKLGGTEHMSSTEVFAELAKKVPAFAGLTYGKVGSRGALLPELVQAAEPAAAQA
ncbi:MAG: 2Fe-2S iron-sulfur cluster binding domain-containing protein [Deltaproteobacteria bacterium]|nr:MAG: 2Fe-2S iron-sulfur cluster binding domain-containing protein [Deltaproteobacteria bacterium]